MCMHFWKLKYTGPLTVSRTRVDCAEYETGVLNTSLRQHNEMCTRVYYWLSINRICILSTETRGGGCVIPPRFLGRPTVESVFPSSIPWLRFCPPQNSWSNIDTKPQATSHPVPHKLQSLYSVVKCQDPVGLLPRESPLCVTCRSYATEAGWVWLPIWHPILLLVAILQTLMNRSLWNFVHVSWSWSHPSPSAFYQFSALPTWQECVLVRCELQQLYSVFNS